MRSSWNRDETGLVRWSDQECSGASGLSRTFPRTPSTGRILVEKSDQGVGEGLRLLEVRQVGGRREDHQLAPLDPLVHDLRGGHRRALILLAHDDEGRER